MSHNPSKRERWPVSRQCRHVWVLWKWRWQVPVQGFVTDWKKVKGKWWASVLYIDERTGERARVERWFPVAQLVPVRTIPEDLMGNPFLKSSWDQRVNELSEWVEQAALEHQREQGRGA